jgi:hypothetical protein
MSHILSGKAWALNPAASAPEWPLDRHFMSKHGEGAYYGNDAMALR